MQRKVTTDATASFTHLNEIACNTTVHLQILTPTKAIRLKTQLIGVDPHMSIILAMRNDQDWSIARNYIREGQGAIIRLMSVDPLEPGIIAFRTNIQKIMNIAGNWLVMNYPKVVQKASLRKHSRIAIKTTCSIVEKTTQKQLSTGHLHDISINGCAFVGRLITRNCIAKEYDLHVKLNNQADELIIPVSVKNHLEIERGLKQQYGLSFQDNTQKTQDIIQKILLEHLSLSI